MSSLKVITPSGGVAVVSDDAALSTYFTITRGAKSSEIDNLISTLITSTNGDPEKIVDIFALWIHTRDSRGGKGERMIAEDICFALLKHYPETTIQMLKLLPDTYGSWTDINSILSKLSKKDKKDESSCSNSSSEQRLHLKAINLYHNQLFSDLESDKPSLAGKWAPREKSKNDNIAKILAEKCFPDSKTPNKDYRKLIVKLNKKLNTTEIMMCSHDWKNINPSSIPSKCLTNNRKAFLNENLKNKNIIRFPNDDDRIECSKKMKSSLSGSGKGVHGASVQPHELIKDYLTQLLNDNDNANTNASIKQEVEPDIVIEAQWKDLVKKLRKELGEGLGQLIPIVDIGCNNDIGLLPAIIAHAILLSECAPITFRNRILTFADKPKWINLENENNNGENDNNENDGQLLKKIKIILKERENDNETQHCVKDLEGAIKMMLDICQQASLPVEEVSSLRFLILSNMEFETCWKGRKNNNKIWKTTYESLKEMFIQANYHQLPEIIYWSVASKSLSKGEKFILPLSNQNQSLDGNKTSAKRSLELELSSDSSNILCGACLAYDDQGKYIDTSCYTMRSACNGSLKHSGDQLIDGKSKHRINIDFNLLPENVNSLFFSLCACGPNDLSSFQRPYINLTDGITKGNLCRYDLSDSGKSPSALMAAMMKIPGGGGWTITALGDDAKTKCCGNYTEMRQMCCKHIKPPLLNANDGNMNLLPVSSDTIGVRLLSGFSADMLKCLVVSEEEEEAINIALEAEKKAKEAEELAEIAANNAVNELGAASEEEGGTLEIARQAREKADEMALTAKEAMIAAKSPAGKLRRTLRSERYQPVRELVAQVGEGDLAGYTAPIEWVKV